MSVAEQHIVYREPEEMQLFRNPPIGTTVQWFPYADTETPQDKVTAGIVTGHEGPGILAMTLFGRNQNPRFMFGVRHNSDPFHKDRRETTIKNGGWDFLPSYRQPTPPALPPSVPTKTAKSSESKA